MMLDAFWYHICEIVILGSSKALLVDLSQHLLIYSLNGKTNYASTSKTLNLGW